MVVAVVIVVVVVVVVVAATTTTAATMLLLLVFPMQDKSVLDLVSDPAAGTPEDKMRLFIIYYILSPDFSDADLPQYEATLQEMGADTSPLSYLKKWK